MLSNDELFIQVVESGSFITSEYDSWYMTALVFT